MARTRRNTGYFPPSNEVYRRKAGFIFSGSWEFKKRTTTTNSEPELELSDLRNISNSDGQEFPATAETQDKQNLSVSPPIVPPFRATKLPVCFQSSQVRVT